jgi:mono/diheme cytochrome c family protein
MQALSKRRWLWGLAAVAVILIGVAVFQPVFGGEQAATPALEVVAAPVAADSVQAEVVAVEMQPAETTASEETSSQDVPVADTPSSDNCIACHTNQTLLQQLAVEPEKVESELAGGEG